MFPCLFKYSNFFSLVLLKIHLLYEPAYIHMLLLVIWSSSPSFFQIVGHSLGGGTAALLTYILREQKELSSSTCVTFAPGTLQCASLTRLYFKCHFPNIVLPFPFGFGDIWYYRTEYNKSLVVAVVVDDFL